jgi:putative FmdB family regulatory protein
MPIYEYKCSECSTKFDVLHKSTTNLQDVQCPACDSKNNKKLFSSFSSKTDNNINHSDSNCYNGSCSLPGTGCSSGMCGFN